MVSIDFAYHGEGSGQHKMFELYNYTRRSQGVYLCNIALFYYLFLVTCRRHRSTAFFQCFVTQPSIFKAPRYTTTNDNVSSAFVNTSFMQFISDDNLVTSHGTLGIVLASITSASVLLQRMLDLLLQYGAQKNRPKCAQ